MNLTNRKDPMTTAPKQESKREPESIKDRARRHLYEQLADKHERNAALVARPTTSPKDERA